MASKHHLTRICPPYCITVLALLLSSYAMADREIAGCLQQLAGMTTCLAYVGGESKEPTPDCCRGLKEAIKNSKRCLCVIIKYGSNPNLGLKINKTLAFGLPSLCKAPENLSQCPASLLHLDPKSAEAQIFDEINKHWTNGGTSSPTSSPDDEGKIPTKNETCCNGTNLLGLKILVAELVIWFFTST